MLSRSALLLAIVLTSLAAGCAHVAEPRDKTATKAPKLSKERQVLSEGYSLLYQDAQKFDAAEALRDIDEHGVTNTHLVPTQFIRLLKLPPEVREQFDGSSLQIVWHGAPNTTILNHIEHAIHDFSPRYFSRSSSCFGFR